MADAPGSIFSPAGMDATNDVNMVLHKALVALNEPIDLPRKIRRLSGLSLPPSPTKPALSTEVPRLTRGGPVTAGRGRGRFARAAAPTGFQRIDTQRKPALPQRPESATPNPLTEIRVTQQMILERLDRIEALLEKTVAAHADPPAVAPSTAAPLFPVKYESVQGSPAVSAAQRGSETLPLDEEARKLSLQLNDN